MSLRLKISKKYCFFFKNLKENNTIIFLSLASIFN